MAEQRGNPVVAIAAVIGGISLSVVFVILILAKDQLSIAPWIVGALALMGLGLGFFASKV